MRCPFCSHENSAVKDTRPGDDLTTTKRRRQCPECFSRFTTIERIFLRDLSVKKKDNRVEGFNRDKLTRAIRLALHKRPVDDDRVDRLVSSIIRQFETSGETEIPSYEIGELVMSALMDLDSVAYVRFASIYKDFHKAQDFEDFIEGIGDE